MSESNEDEEYFRIPKFEYLRKKELDPLDLLPMQTRVDLLLKNRKPGSIPGLVPSNECEVAMRVPPCFRATTKNMRRPKLQSDQKFWNSMGPSEETKDTPKEPVSPWEQSDFLSHYRDVEEENELKEQKKREQLLRYQNEALQFIQRMKESQTTE